jgi:hypothetical protein
MFWSRSTSKVCLRLLLLWALICSLRWNWASSLKDENFGSKKPSCTPPTQKKERDFFLFSHNDHAWTCLILNGYRWNFLLTLHAVVVKTCACWANHVTDLQGECSHLVPVLSRFSSVSTAFCLGYFLIKKCTFFTNSKIDVHVGIWIVVYLWKNQYISPFKFYKQTKQMSECHTWTETGGRLTCFTVMPQKIKNNSDTV